MSAFLLTYLGTLIDEFRRSGEVGGGAKWIQPLPQFYYIAYNPITQPSTQHYLLLEHARCRAQGYPKG
jgi:hypothetical protein